MGYLQDPFQSVIAEFHSYADMHRKLLVSLFAAALAVLPQVPLAASQPPFFSFRTPDDSVQIRQLIQQYLEVMDRDTFDIVQRELFCAGEFAEEIGNRHGVPLRLPKQTSYQVSSVRPVRSNGDFAIATVSTEMGVLPLFGPMTIDWVFFAELTDAGWRISSLRRQNGADPAMQMLRTLDTLAEYPPSLKPVIARDRSGVLLSNEQLRRHFAEHRNGFQTLAGQFHRSDSLYMVSRNDRVITQLNHVGFEWGVAAQDVPQQAIDEFMKTANAEQQQYMREQLKIAAKMRAYGLDTLQRVANRFGLSMARLDSAVRQMHDLRITFINTRLPWPGSVQLTVAGSGEDAVGYLYSPTGDMPFITPWEYFYLEELGNGWWIFRAT